LPDREAAHSDAVRVFSYRTFELVGHISLTAVAFARRIFKALEEEHVELFVLPNLRGRSDQLRKRRMMMEEFVLLVPVLSSRSYRQQSRKIGSMIVHWLQPPVPYAEGSSLSGAASLRRAKPGGHVAVGFPQASFRVFSFSKSRNSLYSVREAGSFSFITKSKHSF
jgi:hypothetical protein